MLAPSKDFWANRKVVVTGGYGFVGRRVVAQLSTLTAKVTHISHRTGSDLLTLNGTSGMRGADIVINCAANQGGIAYQQAKPATILYENLLMGANAMEGARQAGVRRYVNIIPSCAYPDSDGAQVESSILTGEMHESIENYGMAKRAALMLAKHERREHGFDAVSVVLPNLYGPLEYNEEGRSHALAALIARFSDAVKSGDQEVVVWGSGRPVREWLFGDDAATGIILAAEHLEGWEPMNIGTGEGTAIAELAWLVAQCAGFTGTIRYDHTKPDGAMHKTLDVTKMRSVLGDWSPPTSLLDGIRVCFEAANQEAKEWLIAR